MRFTVYAWSFFLKSFRRATNSEVIDIKAAISLPKIKNLCNDRSLVNTDGLRGAFSMGEGVCLGRSQYAWCFFR